MDICWFGHSCFRLQSSQATILTDPFDLPPDLPVDGVDIITVSDRVLRARIGECGTARVVDGPGEYEINGVPITGIAILRTKPVEAGADGATAVSPVSPVPAPAGAPQRNFIYTVLADGILVCHLGRMTDLPSAQQINEVGSPDVVLVPLGGPFGLAPARAAQLASQLEAKLLIPMLLGGPNDQAALESFCKELGADPTPVGTRLSISASSVGSQTRVTVLRPQTAAAPAV